MLGDYPDVTRNTKNQILIGNSYFDILATRYSSEIKKLRNEKKKQDNNQKHPRIWLITTNSTIKLTNAKY